MRRSCLWMLLLPALAGCAGTGPADDAALAEEPSATPLLLPKATPSPDAGAAATQPLPTAPGRDDAFRLPVEATTEGAVRAFVLDIPEGAAVATWYDGESPIVEYRVLGDAGLDVWAVVLVDLDGARVMEAISGTPAAIGGASAGTSAGSRDIGGGAPAGYAWLDGLEAGDRLGVVVAMRGNGTADLGLRFAEEDPLRSGTYDLAPDAATFLGRTSGHEWLPVETGRAEGLVLDTFYDVEGLVFPYAGRYVVGDVQVTETVPDAAGHQPANDLQVVAPGTDGTGFSTALAWSWTEMHAGQASFDLRARDAERVQGSTVLVPDPVVTSVVAMAVGDGDGPSSASLHLTYAGAPGLFPKLAIVDHFALGDSLENLFGTPVEDGSHGAGPVATRQDAGLLVFETDGFRRTLHVPPLTA